jgi:hypothetical protein
VNVHPHWDSVAVDLRNCVDSGHVPFLREN